MFRVPTKLVWSKQGWRRTKISDQEREELKSVRLRRHITFEFGRAPPLPIEMALIQESEDEIQTHGMHGAVDALPNSVKDLLYHSHVWHIRNSRGRKQLFKVVDPITQAKFYGEWGIDLTEREEDRVSITRKVLEDAGQVIDRDEEPFIDLGEGTVLSSLLRGSKEDMAEVPYLSKDVHEFSGEDEANDEDHDAATFSAKCRSTAQGMVDSVEDILDSSKAYTEEQMDKLLEPLTYSLNSPYTALGYLIPRRRYEYIPQDIPSPLTAAADDRKSLLVDLLVDAGDISSIQDLGVGEFYKTGMNGKIHPMYEHDKLIALAWTEEARLEQRASYIHDLREQGIDEETIRSKTWINFDSRKDESLPAEYGLDGELTHTRVTRKDSYWINKRATAFQDLFLTRSQWDMVYQTLAIRKARLFSGSTSEREAALVALKESFATIETLADLINHEQWARRRSINSEGKILPSILDQISIADERRWDKIRKTLQRQLKQKIQAGAVLADCIISSESLGREVVVSCPYSVPEKSFDQKTRVLIPCNAYVVGEARFATIQDGLGLPFITCDSCGKPIWLAPVGKLLTKEQADAVISNCLWIPDQARTADIS